MDYGVQMVLDSTQSSSMGNRLTGLECRYRDCGIGRGGAGRNPRTFRGGTVGAIVFGGTLPGCRTGVWHLVPAASVRLSMYYGGSVLSAVRALHRRRPNAGHAKNADGQHDNAGDAAQW